MIKLLGVCFLGIKLSITMYC